MNKLMTATQVAEIFNVKPSTVRRWVKEKRFPSPLQVSGRTFRWKSEDVQGFLMKGNKDE